MRNSKQIQEEVLELNVQCSEATGLIEDSGRKERPLNERVMDSVFVNSKASCQVR